MTKHLSQTEAHDLIVRTLRAPNRNPADNGDYDLYLPDVLARSNPDSDPSRLTYEQPFVRENIPVCAEAAWLLCCRAILRPEPKTFRGQDAGYNFGYSLTSLGKVWLKEIDDTEYIPTEPIEIAKLLEAYRGRFGLAFQERTQEAIRCWTAHAYLACCVMCGAAAESILLTLAGSKRTESEVLKVYRATGGRQKVERMALADAPEHVQRTINPGLGLLKYWRDDAAHGHESGITESEAHTSIVLLLRLASAVSDRWPELVPKKTH
ncbi:MAG: hypothetical protein ABSE59_11730 [Opitutaceae bacterium]|jgi:hypothetical protein